MIPCDFGKASADLLKAAGYPLEWRTYPMDHSLCLEEVQDLELWLAHVMSR